VQQCGADFDGSGHSLDQFLHREGFGENIVHAGLAAGVVLSFTGVSSKGDDGHVG
jgi:hypothetical protein